MTKPVIRMSELSEKQREAWKMRFRWGWRISRIAEELGISPSGVSRMLSRSMALAGLGHHPYIRILRTKPQTVRLRSLSEIANI